MSFIVLNSLLQQMLPAFVKNRDLFEVREAPSRTFSWFTFISSQITSEVPFQIVLGTIGFSAGIIQLAYIVMQNQQTQCIRVVHSCGCYKYPFMYISLLWVILLILSPSWQTLQPTWPTCCFHCV